MIFLNICFLLVNHYIKDFYDKIQAQSGTQQSTGQTAAH
jgi:hypothetical protein